MRSVARWRRCLSGLDQDLRRLGLDGSPASNAFFSGPLKTSAFINATQVFIAGIPDRLLLEESDDSAVVQAASPRFAVDDSMG